MYVEVLTQNITTTYQSRESMSNLGIFLSGLVT